MTPRNYRPVVVPVLHVEHLTAVYESVTGDYVTTTWLPRGERLPRGFKGRFVRDLHGLPVVRSEVEVVEV